MHALMAMHSNNFPARRGLWLMRAPTSTGPRTGCTPLGPVEAPSVPLS